MTQPAPAPWKVGDPDPTPLLEDDSYCYEPLYVPGEPHARTCSWQAGEDHPAWHVHVRGTAGRPGVYTVANVWPVQQPIEGREVAPRDRLPWRRGHEAMGLDDGAWTDAMAMAGRELGINRQCSIGWHNECSHRRDGAAARCRCLCHAAGAAQ